MPSAGTNCAVQTGRHPDFWELTNYGSESIDLTGYRVWDEDVQISETVLPAGTSIAPMESIVFVRTDTTLRDAATFREWWWGNATGGPPVQIFFYSRPGFDEGGETLYLWNALGNLVDRLEYPGVPEYSGITLTVDPAGGAAAVRSEINIAGAFQSAVCDDVGSPGFAPNPVPLEISEDPRDISADAGALVRLHVRASGLPRPMSYDWYRNGTFVGRSGGGESTNVPSLINFAGSGLAWEAVKTMGDLELANVQPAQAGDYFVVVGNGVQTRTSDVARVTVNADAAAPQIEAPSRVTWFPTPDGGRETNLVVSESQKAIFGVSARGYPSPTFQWSHSANGLIFVDIPAGTNEFLTIESADETKSGIYCVEVQNIHGKIYAYARLTLAPKPQLRITEAMPLPCELTRHDWWELTNIGPEPVNLAGYRWDDGPGVIGSGPTITNAVIIQPGESIIFLESQTPESFRSWWGEENLPKNLRFIVYGANGLTETGDQLNLWNHSALETSDKIHAVSFSGAQTPVTYWFDVPTCSGFYFGVPTTDSFCGAFRASNGCDVGSPGWTRWTPPAFSNIHYTPSDVRLQWKAQAGSANIVQYASSPTGVGTGWTTLGTFTFSTVSGTTTDTTIGPPQQRFYRIVRISEADCPCPEENENSL
jgi:hypothetical protein